MDFFLKIYLEQEKLLLDKLDDNSLRPLCPDQAREEVDEDDAEGEGEDVDHKKGESPPVQAGHDFAGCRFRLTLRLDGKHNLTLVI